MFVSAPESQTQTNTNAYGLFSRSNSKTNTEHLYIRDKLHKLAI